MADSPHDQDFSHKAHLGKAVSAGNRVRRFVFRTVKRIAWTIALVVGLILATLAALQLTEPGRAFVLRSALEQTNALIPGTVQAGRLEQLSLMGVELFDLEVKDPAGSTVLTVKHLKVRTTWQKLIFGTLSLEEVTIEGAEVDLRVMTEREGLLAAFVDPAAEPSPPSDAPPPDIWAKNIHVQEVTARLPAQDPLGQVDAHLAALDASFSMVGGNMAGDLRELRLTATREGQEVLSLEASGRLPRDDSPLRVSLSANSLSMKVKAEAELVSPLVPGFEQRPMRAELSVSGVTGARLAELLRDPSLKQQFLGEIGLELRAAGTPLRPNAEGRLTTAGGALELKDLSFGPGSARAVVATSGIDLDQVRSDLPPHRVAAEVRAEISGFPPEDSRFSLQIRDATLDGEALVQVDAGGRYSGKKIEDLTILASDGDSQIKVSGEASTEGAADLAVQVDLRPPLVHRLGSLTGQDVTARVRTTAQVHREVSGQLSVDGQVKLDGVVLTQDGKESLRAESIQLEVQASGTPPDLSGSVEGQVTNVVLGDQVVDEGTLRASGTADSISVSLQAKGGRGALPESGERSKKDSVEVAVSAQIKRSGSSTSVSGRIEGQVQGQQLEVELGKTTLSESGEISTAGMTVRIGGQEIEITGDLGGAAEEGITAQFGPIQLEDTALVTQFVPDAVGTISGKARLLGSTKAPVIRASVTGKGLGLKRRPLVDLDVAAHLDAPAGELSLSSKASSKEDLAATVELNANFRGGPGYEARLSEADLELEVKVARLTSDFLAGYLPPGSLPLDLDVESRVLASGTLADLQLDTESRVVVDVPGEKPTRLTHKLHFAQGKANTELGVSDGKGAILSATAHLDLPGEVIGAEQLGAALSSVGAEATWEVQVTAPARELRQMTVLSLVTDPSELPPVATQFNFEAKHEPGEEPLVSLSAEARNTGGAEGVQCSDQDVRLSLDVTHGAQGLTAQLLATRKGKRLLSAEARMPLSLKPALVGRELSPGPVEVTLDSERLQLETLPVVCEQLQGEVTLTGEGHDLLGARPSASLAAQVRGLSLGNQHRTDLGLTVDIAPESLSAELDARQPGTPSTVHLDLELPWSLSGGKLEVKEDAPLDAHLSARQWPLASVLPRGGPISYARGHLESEISVSGQLDSPELRGSLDLKDVGFTATSVAQPLRGVQSHIEFRGRKIAIEHFEAHDRDGVLELTGEVDLAKLDDIKGQIRIDANDFPIRQRGQVVATTDMKAVAESRVTSEKTEARLTLKEVDTWLESASIRTGIGLDGHSEFVIDGEPTPGSDLAKAMAEAEASRKGRGGNDKGEGADGQVVTEDAEGHPVYIFIDSEQGLWVKRADFAVKLSTRLKTEIAQDDVRVNGDVVINRGYLQLFGRVFDLTRESKLSFIGSSPPNPVLEIKAEHTTREGTRIGVMITGRGDSPELKFLVEDQEVEAGVAVQELLGGRKSGAGEESDAAGQAKSFVSGLTAGVLATAARKELGAAAPIIMFDPAEETGEGRIRAGFELDELVPKFLQPIVTGVYLEGIVARESQGGESSATTQFGALLEFYFPKNLFTAGQYGPGTTWSVDFGWQL